jgi:uncharacterized membrane protein YqjE
MANRAEKRGPQITEIPENRRAVPEPFNPQHGPAPSVPAALEKLATATQRVISKRIDLVALESHELVAGLITRAALIAFGAVVGIAAWVTGVAALVLYLMPDSGREVQLAVYAGINAVIAAVVVAFAMRERLPALASESGEDRQDQGQRENSGAASGATRNAGE